MLAHVCEQYSFFLRSTTDSRIGERQHMHIILMLNGMMGRGDSSDRS